MGRRTRLLLLAAMLAVPAIAGTQRVPVSPSPTTRPTSAAPTLAAPMPASPKPAEPTPVRSTPRPAMRTTVRVGPPSPIPEPTTDAPAARGAWGGYIGAIGPYVDRALARGAMPRRVTPVTPPPRPPREGADRGGAAPRPGADSLTSALGLPKVVALGPATPNPSAGTVTFRLDLPATAVVRLTVMDVAGRLVFQSTEQHPAGRHTLTWTARRADQGGRMGVYFIRVQVDGRTISTRRTVVIP